MSDTKNMWDDVKATFLAIEVDFLDNAKGNVAAGIRSRHGLRMVKKKLADLIRTLLEQDLERKKERKLKREAKKK